MANAAMVTLAIGEPHLENWKRHCASGWKAYCEKHGYDLLVVTEPLDVSPRAAERSPSWQKCLLVGHEQLQKYDQLILLDSDIAINALAAPPITDQVSLEKVGGVISGSHIPEDLRALMISRLRNRPYEYQPGLSQWQADQADYYRSRGFAPRAEGIVQGGVLVASPARHRELFATVYRSDSGGRSFEQLPLSHALLNAGVFQQIDTRFNSVFLETAAVYYPYFPDTPDDESFSRYMVQVQFQNNFFLHFAYRTEFLKYVA